MTKSTKGPLFAEVHNVPDDYHFTEEELDRIIAGDMFTPRQGAIMARELQERRKAAMDSEPVAYIIQDRYEREGGVEGHLSRSHVSKYVSQEDINEHEIICTPLFKAPSLTHSIPDEWTFQNTQRYREDTGRQDAWPAMWGWNACLAAMRQAGNSPAIPDTWIPVSERMPGRYYVLAADFSGRYYPPSQPNTQVGIHDDWFGDGKPTWDDGDGNDLHLKQVTHWMELPAAPQEVVNGQD